MPAGSRVRRTLWNGNSVLTAHVTDSNGLPGPFANLVNLKYGERIIVHLYDQQYIFEVRNKRLVRPETTDFAFEHLEIIPISRSSPARVTTQPQTPIACARDPRRAGGCEVTQFP